MWEVGEVERELGAPQRNLVPGGEGTCSGGGHCFSEWTVDAGRGTQENEVAASSLAFPAEASTAVNLRLLAVQAERVGEGEGDRKHSVHQTGLVDPGGAEDP